MKKFKEFYKNPIIHSERWSLMNYTEDEVYTRRSEKPDSFEKLKELVFSFCPNISKKDWDVLFDIVVRYEAFDDNDYYGGGEVVAEFTANVEEVVKSMYNLGLITDEQYSLFYE